MATTCVPSDSVAVCLAKSRGTAGLVLHLRRLHLVILRKEVLAGGQHLSKLDECRSEVLERHTDVLGLCVGLGPLGVAEDPFMKRNESLEPDDAHHISETMAHKRMSNVVKD